MSKVVHRGASSSTVFHNDQPTPAAKIAKVIESDTRAQDC